MKTPTKASADIKAESLLVRTTYFAVSSRQDPEQLAVWTQREKQFGLSASQAAQKLGVSLGTLRRWVDMGFLQSFRTPGGQRRFSHQQIDAFVERSTPPSIWARGPDLASVAIALQQTDRFMTAALELTRLDWIAGHWTGTPVEVPKLVSQEVSGRVPYRVVSIRMESPLTVVLELPPETWMAMAAGLVVLAERISTFGPRVSRRRKQALLEAAVYERAREELLAGRADGLALAILSGEPRISPDQIDFLDAGLAENEGLEDLRASDDPGEAE